MLTLASPPDTTALVSIGALTWKLIQPLCPPALGSPVSLNTLTHRRSEPEPDWKASEARSLTPNSSSRPSASRWPLPVVQNR